MGDRISVSFKRGNDESVAIYSHWGGIGFYKMAVKYVMNLRDEINKNQGVMPLDRLEPGTVMVDFIRYITKDMDRVSSDLYLCASSEEGDNSDNGHFTIDLDDPLSD